MRQRHHGSWQRALTPSRRVREGSVEVKMSKLSPGKLVEMGQGNTQ